MVAVWEYFRKPWCSKVGVLGILLLCIGMGYKPLLAVYYQQLAGRELARVIPPGQNDYGGFACLSPFIEDLEQRQKLKRAEEFLTKSSQVMPKLAHTYYQLGRIYCLLGDYERSIPAFQTFSELRPRNPLANLELGFALLQACPPNGKCADGLNSYDVWRRAGVTPEHFQEMAERERQRENYAEALLWYQQAQRMGRELRSTIAYIRYLLFKAKGDEERALQALQSAVEMDEGWLREEFKIWAMNDYGFSIYYSQYDCIKASKIFSKVVNLTYNNCEKYPFQASSAHFHIGLCLYINNQYQEALGSFSKALECGSNYSWMQIWYAKALYMVDPNNKKSATEHFIRGLELSNDKVDYWKEVLSFWGEHDEKNLLSDFCNLAKTKNIIELQDVCNK